LWLNDEAEEAEGLVIENAAHKRVKARDTVRRQRLLDNVVNIELIEQFAELIIVVVVRR